MSYDRFADFYDKLTSNINYAGYARRIDGIIRSHCLKRPDIVELACGTMSLGLELYSLGYTVSGVDISKNMLKYAEEKIAVRGFSIPVYNSDITDFTLPRKSGAFVCSLDGLNHLDGMGSVAACFRAVRRNIQNGGLFIFDMNTPYKHSRVLGDNSFIYELPGLYCGWQNEYRGEDCSVKITLDFFSRENGDYRRFRESFREYAYPENDVKKALIASGFRVLGTYDGIKNSPPGPRTERILYAARSI